MEKENIAAGEAPVSLSVRSGVSDTQRQINFILEAPTACIAIATDGFGRLLLIDTKAGAVVRMWKGYREAQCGWITGKALLLVVHIPWRGILEVWKMRHGARISAQSISLGWCLVPAYDTCYIMDKNGVLYQLVLRE